MFFIIALNRRRKWWIGGGLGKQGDARDMNAKSAHGARRGEAVDAGGLSRWRGVEPRCDRARGETLGLQVQAGAGRRQPGHPSGHVGRQPVDAARTKRPWLWKFPGADVLVDPRSAEPGFVEQRLNVSNPIRCSATTGVCLPVLMVAGSTARQSYNATGNNIMRHIVVPQAAI